MVKRWWVAAVTAVVVVVVVAGVARWAQGRSGDRPVPDVVVRIRPAATADEEAAVREQLLTDADVEHVDYVSRETTLALMRCVSDDAGTDPVPSELASVSFLVDVADGRDDRAVATRVQGLTGIDLLMVRGQPVDIDGTTVHLVATGSGATDGCDDVAHRQRLR
jgi:cell division protein FtsX